MSGTINFGVMLINLAGGLALFLYGMHKMTEALKILARRAGVELEPRTGAIASMESCQQRLVTLLEGLRDRLGG